MYNGIFLKSKSVLEMYYLTQRQTTREIGRTYGVSHVTISQWLKDYGIPIRENCIIKVKEIDQEGEVNEANESQE